MSLNYKKLMAGEYSLEEKLKRNVITIDGYKHNLNVYKEKRPTRHFCSKKTLACSQCFETSLMYYRGIKFVVISILQPGIFHNTGDCIATMRDGYSWLPTCLVDTPLPLNNLRQEVSVKQTIVEAWRCYWTFCSNVAKLHEEQAMSLDR